MSQGIARAAAWLSSSCKRACQLQLFLPLPFLHACPLAPSCLPAAPCPSLPVSACAAGPEGIPRVQDIQGGDRGQAPTGGARARAGPHPTCLLQRRQRGCSMQAPRIYHCMAPSRLSSSSLTCRRAARPCRLSSGVRRWRGASGGARSRWTARPARWAALPARHARLPCPALPASSASRQLLPGSPSGAAQPAGSASVHRLVAPWPAPPCLQIVDRESRQLALMIASTRRPVELDEAEQQVGDGGGLVVGWWGRRVGGWVLGGWGLHRVVGRGRQTGGSCWALRAVSLPGRQLTGLGPCCPACSAHALGASASLTCHAPPPPPASGRAGAALSAHRAAQLQPLPADR